MHLGIILAELLNNARGSNYFGVIRNFCRCQFFFKICTKRRGTKWGCMSKIFLKFQNTISDPFMIVVDFFVFGWIEYSSWFQFLCLRDVLKLIVWVSFWNYIACWKFHLKMSNLEFHSLLSLAISSEVNQSQAKKK